MLSNPQPFKNGGGRCSRQSTIIVSHRLRHDIEQLSYFTNFFIFEKKNMFEAVKEEEEIIDENCRNHEVLPVKKLSDTSVHTEDSGQFSASSANMKLRNGHQEVMAELETQYKNMATYYSPKMEK